MKRIVHSILNSLFSLIFLWLLLQPQAVLAASELSLNAASYSEELKGEITVSDDNLLVVEMIYEGLLLEESVFVFHTPDYTFIPLQILIDALDLPLDIDLDTLTMDGWFINERNSISLNILAEEIYLRGEKLEWPQRFIYANDGFDLYLDIAEIKSWLNLDLHLDVSQLRLSLESETPLPMLEKKLREEKRKKVKKSIENAKPSEYIPNTYDWIGHPTLDIELSYDGQEFDSEDPDTKLITRQRTHSASAAVQGTMDALKHSLQVSYTKQKENSDLRLTMRKSASRLDESIWPGVDSYAFGDLSTHSDKLIYNTATGLGFSAAKGNGQIQDSTSTLMLEGDAPPGWEVELYRNGSLVDFAEANTSGQFVFDDINTYLGENVFDIRIYGPQGQYREQQKRLHISSQMLKPGHWNYQAYTLKEGQSIIKQQDDRDEKSTNFDLVDAYIGLGENLTTGLSIARFVPEANEEEKTYVSLSSFSSLFGGLLQTKIASNDDSGSAHLLAYKSRWHSLNYNIEYSKFNHLISDRNSDNSLRSDIEINVNGVIQDLTQGLLPLSLSYDFALSHFSFRNNQEQWLFDKRLSTKVFDTQIAHNMKYSHHNSPDVSDSLDGSLALTRRFNKWRGKVESSYTLKPAISLLNINASASYRADTRFNYMANLSYTNTSQQIVSFDNTLSWRFQPASLSLTFGMDSEDSKNISLGLNTSLSFDKAKRSLHLDSNSSANQATALVRAFVDENNNNRFDDHEQPLEGVLFKGRSSWKERPTNAEGLTTLNAIPNLNLQEIAVDDRSVEDPFLHAPKPSIHLYSHAGKRSELSFAFVPSLEIEGEIIIKSGEKIRPATGIQLRLVDTKSKNEFTTISEYDGIFLFTKVFPGEYTLHIDLKNEKDSFSKPSPSQIIVVGDEGVVYAPTQTLELLDPNKEASKSNKTL